MKTNLHIIHRMIFLAWLCLGWLGCGQAFSEQRKGEIRGLPLAMVNDEPIMSETFREGYVA